MKSILITGSNRGLGLGLVKHLAAAPKPLEHIFATCRDINQATELTELAAQSSNIHIIEIDLTHTKEYINLVQAVKSKVGDAGLNVLFNNAGVACKFGRINFVKEEQLIEAFHVNTIAPILLSKAFLPLLKTAANNYKDKSLLNVNRAAIINMTSVLGSIAKNEDGGYYPYRCSKAALNAATKSLSVDLKMEGILVACLHPGWVRTRMGGHNAPMDITTSVTKILELLPQLTNKHTGCFLQYDGAHLPW